ncbi:MAG: Hsp20/alpha crystallin family protein, partial [Thermodesulfobacteriota bacterium]
DEENKENYYRIERSYGQFYRTIPLSTQVEEENVKAKMNNGILQITLPKKEPASGTKKIEIES